MGGEAKGAGSRCQLLARPVQRRTVRETWERTGRGDPIGGMAPRTRRLIKGLSSARSLKKRQPVRNAQLSVCIEATPRNWVSKSAGADGVSGKPSEEKTLPGNSCATRLNSHS